MTLEFVGIRAQWTHELNDSPERTLDYRINENIFSKLIPPV